ncbi:MAG: glycosyltransferase, partial [Caldilineaceae bacterium]
ELVALPAHVAGSGAGARGSRAQRTTAAPRLPSPEHPLRIGVLTHNYPRFAGDFSGTFVEALCDEFARRGQFVTVWTPHDAQWARPTWKQAGTGSVTLRPYRYAWPARLQQLGYMRSMQADLALRLNAYLLSPLLFGAGIFTLLREAGRLRPHLLHAHWALPNGLIGAVASRLLGIPLVVSVPGSDAQVAGANSLFRAMARFTFNQASLLTANSAELRDAVVALGADPAKFDLILYGVDPNELTPDATGVEELRAHWARQVTLPPGQEPIFVLAVGRMVPKKGFDILLRALAEPALKDRPVIAVLIGTGDAEAEWRALAAELGVADRVVWAGLVPKNDIGRWYNAADLLAMPSVSRPADGLNVCVLDAMACGKAVVASNVAGNPLAIAHGQTGFVVPEQQPAPLADAIATLATQPALRAAFGAAARLRLEQELGWPPLAQRYLEHFVRLARR